MLERGGTALSVGGSTHCKDISLIEDAKCCFTSTSIKQDMDQSRVFCCRCAHRRRASPLTCLAICFLVLTYNLLGGFLFLAIEGSVLTEETAVAASKPNLSVAQSSNELRSKTVERLWSITEDLNILYKENWTKLAAKELMEFQKVLMKSMRVDNDGDYRMSLDNEREYRWTFSSSFLYALTLITTIGHGNVTPNSSVGKMVAVAYACVGIPIIMVYLSTIGEALARNVRVLYSKICPSSLHSSEATRSGSDYISRLSSRRHWDMKHNAGRAQRRTPFQAALNLDSLSGGYRWACRDHARVPVLLSLLLMVLYVAAGSLLFHITEQWSVTDGCYFSFSSLATIGFGALRPGERARAVSDKAGELAVSVCCLYILVGIVVVAMCFNLIHEEAGAAVRGLSGACAGARTGLRAVHSTGDDSATQLPGDEVS